MYNPFWQQPEPLVPRHLRRGIRERMRADGKVHLPLHADDVAEVAAYFCAEKVDSIAVCLMNAYANPAHELEVADLVREAGFEGALSLSHAISGEYREYERTSTTVIDAFVRGRMADYLQRLEAELRTIGFKGRCLVTRSGSGSMTFAEARDRPFETIMSGPVAGAQGASELARALGLDAIITADVGGTSFDTCLIIDGEPKVNYQGEVAGMPVQTPWVDVRSIGSGGGSIASVDRGGLMSVGPRSAGAEPGPAAYGKGGVEPTTTDAAAHLGMLGPGRLAAGINIDFDKARAAIGAVAGGIAKSVDETAVGILRIAAASMANAMREISVEQGLDPRQMALLPFGGAGPMMSVLLANELGMNRIVVPAMAGNFSAWGLLGADMVQASAQTMIMPLNEAGMERVGVALGNLVRVVEQRSEGGAEGAQLQVRLDLRYAGQEHSLTVPVAYEGGLVTERSPSITERFVEEYKRTFGGVMRQPVEIVSVRLSRLVPLSRQRISAVASENSTVAPVQDAWKAFSFRDKSWKDFQVVDRKAVAAAMHGPMIVTETTTTIYIDAGWSVSTGEMNELIITRQEKM